MQQASLARVLCNNYCYINYKLSKTVYVKKCVCVFMKCQTFRKYNKEKKKNFIFLNWKALMVPYFIFEIFRHFQNFFATHKWCAGAKNPQNMLHILILLRQRQTRKTFFMLGILYSFILSLFFPVEKERVSFLQIKLPFKCSYSVSSDKPSQSNINI